MPRVAPSALVAGRDPEGSAPVARRIAAARSLQVARSGGLNGRLGGRALRAVCGLTSVTASRAIAFADLEGLSGRGTERLLRVARTIADLDGAEAVAEHHLAEAARYRTPMSRLRSREAS
jgi:magnesium chelatase family protein